MTPPTSLNQSAVKPARIAVIEDDRDLREIAVEFLQDKGYVAWGCDSAEEFYRCFAANPVDVLVLDIGLPGEDGLSVARHLRKLPNLRIIIVSARTSEVERRAGLSAGAERYLIKPIILDELARSIEAELALAAVGCAATGAAARPSEMWLLEKESWRLTAPNGTAMVLTSREFAFLHCLSAACGKTVAQDAVTGCVYPGKQASRNERMDVLLSRLRKKCLNHLGIVLPVKTVHLVGYVFTAAARFEQR